MSYSYEAYKREYERAFEAQKKKGLPFAESIYSKIEFNAMVTAKVNDLKDEIAAGVRKGMGNIYKSLVSDQRWAISKKQAEAVYQAARKKGYHVTLDEVRAEFALGNHKEEYEKFKEDVSNSYHQMKQALLEQGFTQKEAVQHAKKYVSREYYSSI